MNDMDVAYWMEKYDKLREEYGELREDYTVAEDRIAELENLTTGLAKNAAWMSMELEKYQWVSVEDKLPEIPKPDEGYCRFLVSDGILIHIAYYTEDGWLFADNGEMKEMFYEVTHWMPLPDCPNHQRRAMKNE